MTSTSALPLALMVLALACSDATTPAPAASDGGVDGSVLDAAGKDAASDAASCKLTKPYSSKNATCNQCAEAHCCAQINGCLGDPRCDDQYVNCILACALLPDDAGADAGIKPCTDQCGKDYPVGKTEYDLAIGCADTQCATECK